MGNTQIRKATQSELDDIFLMGKDIWGSGQNTSQYLRECQTSEKYAKGQWYVLEQDNMLLSSLILYRGYFNLSCHSVGIGSVATHSYIRGSGYGSKLIQSMIMLLLKDVDIEVIYLFCDINPEFYEALGFKKVVYS